MPLRLLFLRRLGIGIALVVKDLVKVCFGSSEGRLISTVRAVVCTRYVRPPPRPSHSFSCAADPLLALRRRWRFAASCWRSSTRSRMMLSNK